MKLFSYESAKQHKAIFLSLTSLTVKEFDELCVGVAETWNEHTNQHEKDPSKGGRPYALDVMEDRLFFILFYLKTYPFRTYAKYIYWLDFIKNLFIPFKACLSTPRCHAIRKTDFYRYAPIYRLCLGRGYNSYFPVSYQHWLNVSDIGFSCPLVNKRFVGDSS